MEITREAAAARGVTSSSGGCGAIVEFAGVVRGEEDGAAIAALDYEAYEAMARSEMTRILREFALLENSEAEVNVGDQIMVTDVFAAADFVDVTGKTKGRGFQGVIKQHAIIC